MKNTLIALFVISTLTGCSSHTAAKNTCYFMEGVDDSQEDEQRQADLKLNRNKSSIAEHIINGLFAILVANIINQEECPEKKD
jgi:hypothetical protein